MVKLTIQTGIYLPKISVFCSIILYFLSKSRMLEKNPADKAESHFLMTLNMGWYEKVYNSFLPFHDRVAEGSKH
jgi:hypothetical protein